MTDEAADTDGIRTRILATAVPLAARDGWSAGVLRDAAVAAGVDPDAAMAAFPGGPADAVAHWTAATDRRVEEAMTDLPLDQMPIDERIVLAVRLRLEPLGGQRDAVRRAMQFLARPGNGALARRLAWETANNMAYAAGDRSTDMRFYAVRAAIAAVYTPTLLYWFTDTSEGCEDTWAFLSRGAAAATLVPRLKSTLDAVFRRLTGGKLGSGGVI